MSKLIFFLDTRLRNAWFTFTRKLVIRMFEFAMKKNAPLISEHYQIFFRFFFFLVISFLIFGRSFARISQDHNHLTVIDFMETNTRALENITTIKKLFDSIFPRTFDTLVIFECIIYSENIHHSFDSKNRHCIMYLQL